MLKRFVQILGGDPNKRTVGKYSELVQQINELEGKFEAFSDVELRQKTGEFKARLERGETLDDILLEAFAAVREASKRTLGLRHYDVQLIGGIALHRGTISEMRTGEGKTLVATLPLYLNALAGRGAHLITVNDYLARRDARWMAPIFELLGLKVGVLQMAARTENGKKAFLVDLERESPHEDQHQLHMVNRVEAYLADITYGTNSEFGFDYLRDNMTPRLTDRVQRGHFYAIIDEVDNILIDEARTPLIISGPASDDTEWYVRMAQVVRQLRPEDYEVSEKDRNVTLTEIGEMHAEELLGIPLRDPERPEDVTSEQARLIGYLEQALRAQFLFKRNKDYLVQGGKVIIVDEFTGRQMPGRRWSDGLHQAVEAKEGARVQSESVTYATITIQNYFRMYDKLAGMSGTALTEAEEFDKIYKLGVLAIPTNLEYQALRPETGLEELEARDESGYKYRYYARKNDAQKQPVFWRRKDYPDVVYRTEEMKFRAIATEILRYHAMGRPVLVGTTSVDLSERLSARLRADALTRLGQVLVLRQVWFTSHNHEEDGRQVGELQFLNDSLNDLPIPEMRKLARDLSISFNPADKENLPVLRQVLGLQPEHDERLLASLKGGISHQVLNARKHTEESQIIAGAGAFGAVTIATNMAGRGVDIRLGGEIPERVINQVRLLLRRKDIAARMHENGLADIDTLPLRQWPDALALVDASELRSRTEAVDKFYKFVQAEEQVRSLGGLHVIGSERHEARRIDNQLRGRSARQGDPGSSRFYLSMEDELMRLFGGQQADGMMQRLKIDDALPLEVGVVGRIVEQAQTRVEGTNFDVRKHLLEYDDVLNSQRKIIYGQRDRIFTKDDLSEDVTEMLRTEVTARVPQSLKDEEGPWKLLAWLDSIQPPLSMNGSVYPSYTLRQLVGGLRSKQARFENGAAVSEALLGVSGEALQAEKEHLLRGARLILETARERLQSQLDERLDALDTFIEGLELGSDEPGEKISNNPRQTAEELQNAVHTPLRLSAEQQRLLCDDPRSIAPELRAQIEEAQRVQALTRLVGALERRVEDDLELAPAQMAPLDWDQIEDQVLFALESFLEKRRERLVGASDGDYGQIGRDLDGVLSKIVNPLTEGDLYNLLLAIPQGARTMFDKKTHRRVWQRTTRLTYIFMVARLLEGREPEDIAEEVLQHLEGGQKAIRLRWGGALWPRVANARWDDLDERTQLNLQALLGAEKQQITVDYPLQSLDKEDVIQVISELGRQALTEVYRGLLLGVISELWVDYLTQMEALRVSIGLEAYAQRDPLVQYKSRASELFQDLLSNVRMGAISRMFTYQPRDVSNWQIGLKRSEGLDVLPAVEAGADVENEPGWPDESEDTPEITEEMEAAKPPEDELQLTRSQKRRRRRK